MGGEPSERARCMMPSASIAKRLQARPALGSYSSDLTEARSGVSNCIDWYQVDTDIGSRVVSWRAQAQRQGSAGPRDPTAHVPYVGG